MDEAARNLRIGTSGWHYPTGRGTWNGIFYPAPRGHRRARFDDLAFYAEHFDTVEVNSTFYGVPPPHVTRGWAARTPRGFEFSLKLYQKFTHPKMYGAARAGTAPSAGSPVEASARPQVTQADIDEFRRGIEPLAEAGKLGALLAQFPPSFKNVPESRDYLSRLLDAFRGEQMAVELRHRSWSDEVASLLLLLNEYGAAWAQIDEPKFRVSIRQNYLPNVKGFYYMRLHGRKAEHWWKHEKSEDRYDYLYAGEELTPFAETADAARRLVKKLYLYMNNHFAAKAVANAAMLKHQLGLPVPGEYPPELVAAYPQLAGIVTVSSPRPLLPTSS